MTETEASDMGDPLYEPMDDELEAIEERIHLLDDEEAQSDIQGFIDDLKARTED